MTEQASKPYRGIKKRGAAKVIRITPDPAAPAPLEKPPWLRVRYPANSAVQDLKSRLRQQRLHTVCEEAACPNIGECFSSGTATFMILGDICTRRCSFCDVAHGRPLAPDAGEPERVGHSVAQLGLRYVVITSVDRDDLKDGGSGHFVRCIDATRARNPDITIEILVPDFRTKMDRALDTLAQSLPDVFNHNIETVPSLYHRIRPGACYQHSLDLIRRFKEAHPEVLTKSGLMLGLGENDDEIISVLQDLHRHGCDLLTLGQYLQPSQHHARVERYVSPEQFEQFKHIALEIGFLNVASGPLVRSSYHADAQSQDLLRELKRSNAR